MHSQPLDAIPLWLFLLVVGALFWGAIEVGYRIGKWRHEKTPDEREQPVGAMVASLLGLLALVLGFTFSLAASRFDARRQTVLEEANAIGTTYLRARMLDEPQRSNVVEQLREYVELRIQTGENRHASSDIARSEVIHEELWSEAQAAAAKDPHSITIGLFIQSLNDMIDLHAKRVLVGLHSRIPFVIWVSLLGLATLGMAAVGYQAGLSTTRRSPAMVVLIMSFALVVLIIADLDRGQEGLLRVSQQALIDTQQTIQQFETSSNDDSQPLR